MEGDQPSESVTMPNIRHEWYQTESKVIVTIFVRNVKENQFAVNFSETALSAIIHLNDTEPYTLKLRLAHRIVPNNCTYKIMQTKIELKLFKKEGIRWSTLEGDPNSNFPKQELPTDCANSGKPSSPLKYPSSNPVHRDWNAIEQELVKEIDQDKFDGEDGCSKLFTKIYNEGSDEVKRAMNKSYIESGGTVLSTNWKKTGKKRVPIQTPDGMEWKKWEK